MASVRLNGDTSGFIEISAPNVAGSTTITLPATSGGNFLVTDSNGDLNVDSGTLFVDASTNRVGIGETSPSTSLHITGANTAARGQLCLEGTSADARMAFYRDADFIGHISGHSDHLNISTESGHHIEFSPAGSEAARFDTSGRLLVNANTAPSGTTTQHSSLSVVGNSAGGANYGAINLCRSEASANITQDEPIGQIDFGDSGAGNYARIKCSCDGNAGTDDYPGRIQFYTTRNGAAAPTERMVITRDGTHRMFSATNFDTLELRYQGSADTGNDIQQCYRDASMTTGVLVCRIRSDGNLQNTNGSYTQISDAKLKENIVDAGSQWDDLKAIQIRNWNFKAETGYETHRQIGPIAQELEEVCPNLVFDTPDKDEEGNDLGTVTKGVNQSVLYMKAVKALQEAMERIETLETANASLEARLTALEGGN